MPGSDLIHWHMMISGSMIMIPCHESLMMAARPGPGRGLVSDS